MENEYTITLNELRPVIKSILAYENMSLTKLKILINHKYGKSDDMANLSKKISTKTIRVNELFEILDILGYELILRKNN